MEKDNTQEIQKAKENGTAGQAVKKKRRWPKVVGIVLLVLVLIFAGILFFLDNILETGIRTGGSMILKTRVEVDSVRLKIFRGTLDIKNLRVANPEGSANAYAFELPGFHFRLDTGSLLTDKIIVEAVEINGLKVDYEPRLRGGSNLQVLLDNMQDPNKQPPPEAAEPKDVKRAEKETSKKIVIRKLSVQGGQISVTLMGQAIPVPLPAITMTGIGEESDVTMAEAVTVFMKKLVASVIDAAAQVAGSVVSAAKSVGEGLGSTAKSVGEGLGSSAGGVVDAAGGVVNAAGGVVENVKSLFGGRKDEKK